MHVWGILNFSLMGMGYRQSNDVEGMDFVKHAKYNIAQLGYFLLEVSHLIERVKN